MTMGEAAIGTTELVPSRIPTPFRAATVVPSKAERSRISVQESAIKN
jgi:hypothetical protein